jgi:hypothetical protein
MDTDLINAAIAAIELRELGESFLEREIVEEFSIERSTLTRRYKRVINTI